MIYDLIVKNAKIVSPDSITDGCVFVKDGKIAAVGEGAEGVVAQ